MNFDQLFLAVIGLIQALTLFLVSRSKKDTTQINNAVNHVNPGMPTLTQRVDVITDDIEMLKATALVTKHEVNARFNSIDEKTDAIRGMIAEGADKQKNILEELAKVRESVDRRKMPNNEE